MAWKTCAYQTNKKLFIIRQQQEKKIKKQKVFIANLIIFEVYINIYYTYIYTYILDTLSVINNPKFWRNFFWLMLVRHTRKTNTI